MKSSENEQNALFRILIFTFRSEKCYICAWEVPFRLTESKELSRMGPPLIPLQLLQGSILGALLFNILNSISELPISEKSSLILYVTCTLMTYTPLQSCKQCH